MGTQKVLRVVVALGFSVSFGTFLVSSVSPWIEDVLCMAISLSQVFALSMILN
jgi:hypothetical protein